LSSDLNWYRGQYKALDALVETLRTDNGWLEYRLRAVQDALLDQRTLTTEGATAVDRVKTALLERDEALAMANDDLQKERATLVEVQTVMAEKEAALTTAQTQLQQDCTTLEGARSWQVQTEQKAKEAEKLSADLAEKDTSLTAMEEQLRQDRARVSRQSAGSSRSSPPSRRLKPPSSLSARLGRRSRANSSGRTPCWRRRGPHLSSGTRRSRGSPAS
jgi:septal ring factor EnvC (AmiA/AmiB activator)